MLATVGLGIAVLIFALSISSATARLITERLGSDDLVATVRIRAETTTGAGLPYSRAEYGSKVTDTLQSDIVGATAASQVEFGPQSSFIHRWTGHVRDSESGRHFGSIPGRDAA